MKWREFTTGFSNKPPEEQEEHGILDTVKNSLNWARDNTAAQTQFLLGAGAEALGKAANFLGDENTLAAKYNPSVASTLRSIGNSADNFATGLLTSSADIAPVANEDSTVGAFANALTGAYTSSMGNLAGMLGLDKSSDAGYSVAQKTANDARVSTDNLWEYFTNPRGLVNDFGQQVGSMAAIVPFMGLAPETAVARGVGALGGDAITQALINRGMYNAAKVFAGGAPRAAKYGLTSAPIEGAMEGGETRRTLLNQGASEEEVTKESLATMAKNIPLLLATNTLEGLAFFSPLKGASKALQIGGRAAANSAQQQYEEFAQEGIQNAALGEPYSWLPWNGAPNQYEAAERVRYPALLMGGFGGAVQSLGDRNENQENWKRGSQENISVDDYSKRANLTTKQAEIWDAAQYASALAKGKFGYDISPELIYKQWGHEAGANFDSENARYNNNFGGLTQTEPNGEENRQPDGNNYYRHFNNVREYADAYVDDFIKYYPEISGTKNEREFASVLKKYGYFGDDLENYVAGMEGIQTPANRTSGNQPKIDFATGLQSARESLDGKQMDNGTVGCVEAVTKILSHVHPEFKKMVEDGVVNTVEGDNSLHSRLEKMGVEIIPFDESQVAQGDIIFYDGKQTYQHVLVADHKDADGNWRVFGNSSSANKVMEQPLYQGQTPSWIAKVSNLQGEQSAQGQIQQKQKESTQEEKSKPLFDINSEDSTTQKLLEQFANDKFSKAIDEEDIDSVNFFNGMFDDNSAFQNTPENRNSISERYGDELGKFIQTNALAETQTKSQETQSTAPQENPFLDDVPLKSAVDNLKAKAVQDKNTELLMRLNHAEQNPQELQNLLKQNGVEISQTQQTQTSRQDPVSQNKPPENILPHKLSANEKLIKAATAQVKSGRQYKKSRQKQGNAIIKLAGQNGIEIPNPEVIALSQGSTKAVQKWRDNLLRTGIFNTAPKTETQTQIQSQQQESQSDVSTQENKPSLKERANRIISMTRGKEIENEYNIRRVGKNIMDMSEVDENGSFSAAQESANQNKNQRAPFENFTEFNSEQRPPTEGQLEEQQRRKTEIEQRRKEEEEYAEWKAKQDKELSELQARQAEAKRLRDESQRQKESDIQQRENWNAELGAEEEENIFNQDNARDQQWFEEDEDENTEWVQQQREQESERRKQKSVNENIPEIETSQEVTEPKSYEQPAQTKQTKSKRSSKAEQLHAKLKTDTHPHLESWLNGKLKEASTPEGKQARDYLKNLAEQDLNDISLENAEENLRHNKEDFDKARRNANNPTADAVFNARQKESEQRLNFGYPEGKYLELKEKISQMSDEKLQAEATSRLERDFDRNFSVQQEAVASVEDLIKRDESQKKENKQREQGHITESDIEVETTQEVRKTAQNILQEQSPKKQEEVVPKDNGVYGNNTRAMTDSKRKYPVRYKVVEVSDLNVSHKIDGLGVVPNDDYRGIQPRNRERVDMQYDLLNMAEHFDPDLALDQALSVNSGAPIIRADGVVLNGNGRTIANHYAYENNDKGELYKNALIERAQDFGLNADEISKMNQPILVRELTTDVSEKEMQDIAGATAGGSGMSSSEQSQSDAKKIPLDTIASFSQGEINFNTTSLSDATKELATRVLQNIATPAELNSYSDNQGKISKAGITRAKNAIVSYAYGNSGLMNRISEDTDDNIRNISNALSNAAPKIAQVKTRMQNGTLHKYDLSAIADAAEKLSDLRNDGKKTVSDYLKEISLEGTGLSSEAREILSFFDKNKRSEKKITDFIKGIAKKIQEQGDPRQGNLFGLSDEPAPLMDLIRRAKEDVENNGQMLPMFSRKGDTNTVIDNFVDDKDLTPQQKLLQSFGKKLGVKNVFFDNKDGDFHGAHAGNISYINVNSNMPIGKVFWHESLHWLKSNNSKLYNELAKAAGITDAQRDAYLERTGRNDLTTDEAIDEEIIADQFEDVAKRTGLLQSIAGKNRSLIQRVVQWLKDTMNKFIDHFRNPEGRLTTKQAIALADEFGKIAKGLVDRNGQKIFRYNRRTHNIELADGRRLDSIQTDENTKYSFDINDENYLQAVEDYQNAKTDEERQAALKKLQDMVQLAAEANGFHNAVPEQTVAYKVRTTAAPKKTIKVYKVFTVANDGSPTALFVGGTEKLPQGVWLDAQDAYHFKAKNGLYYVPSTQNPFTKGGKTGDSVEIPNEPTRQELIKRGFLPKGSKATKITALAYRPGWHAGTLPFFPQGGMKRAGSNYKNIHRYNQVVFECELAADKNYTAEAESQPKARNKDGSLNSRKADLQYMPKDGFYYYATNPLTHGNPKLGNWAISGSLKINRALTQEECDKILADNGKLPQEWEQGKLNLADLGYTGEQNDAARKTLAPITYDDNGNVIPLSQRFDAGKEDIRYSFAGKKAKTADKNSLNRAMAMDASGLNRDQIYRETGWVKGKDNKWRFEIPDNLNKINFGNLARDGKATLGEVYFNPKLYAAYPQLKNMHVAVSDKMETSGQFNPSKNTITLNKEVVDILPDKAKQTLVHELQHAIQNIEGFAFGDGKSNSNYKNLGGEQESREVAARAVKQTKTTPTIHDENAVIIFGGKKHAVKTKQRETPNEIAYSIDSDNSSESLKQKIKNKLASYFDDSRPSARHDKRIKDALQKITGYRILFSHTNSNKTIVDDFNKLIQAKHAYEWEKLLPKIGGKIAQSLKLNPNTELSNYIADWLLTGALNNNSAQAKEFRQAMRDNPEVAELMYNVRNTFQEIADMSAADWYKSKIVHKEKKPLIQRLWGERKNFIEQWFDDLHPVQRMIRQMKENSTPEVAKMIDEMIDPYKMARLLRGKGAIADLMIDTDKVNIEAVRNALREQNPYINFDRLKSLSMIIEEAGGKQNIENFEAYCVAKLDKEIYEKNRANPVGEQYTPLGTEAQADAVIKAGEKKFGQAQRDLVTYSNILLTMQFNAGLISQKQYSAIINGWKNYVPMSRVFDENEEFDLSNSLERKTGSKRDTFSPIAKLICNTHEFIAQAERNKVKLELANIVRCGGYGEIIAEVEKRNPDVEDIISYKENGQKKYLQVADLSIARAINSMQQKSESTWLMKTLHSTSRVMRAFLTVMNPDYAIGNIFRDMADAYIHNKNLDANPFTAAMEVWRAGFKEVVGKKKSQDYIDWLVNGGSQSGFITEDIDTAERSINDLTKGTRKERYTSREFFSQLLDDIGRLAEISEYATRLNTYKTSKAKLASKRADGKATLEDKRNAAFESRNASIDFAKAGRSGRTLNRVVLFSNAALQALSLWGQKFSPAKLKTKEGRKEAASAIFRAMATGIVPAILQAIFRHSDDDWDKEFKNAQNWEKDTYWIFGGVKIPKGVDLSIRLMSAFTDEALDKMIDDDPVEFDRIGKAFKDAAPSLTATILTPAIEAMTNYSFFREAPIVPYGEQHLPASKQYGSNNSTIAKLIGDVIGVSPRKIDYLINGYFGFMGRTVSKAPDFFFKGGITLDEVPMLRRFYFNPYKNPKIVKDYYEAYDEQEKLLNDYKLERQKGNKVSLPEDHDAKLHKRIKAAQEPMRKLSKLEKKILDDPNLSFGERQEKIRELEKKRIALCEKVFQRAR